MGTLASETAKSMALCVNGRPCEDLAPLRHVMAERKREKLMQHLIHAIVAPYVCSLFVDRRVAILLYVTEAHFPIPPDVLNTKGVNEPCSTSLIRWS